MSNRSLSSALHVLYENGILKDKPDIQKLTDQSLSKFANDLTGNSHCRCQRVENAMSEQLDE